MKNDRSDTPGSSKVAEFSQINSIKTHVQQNQDTPPPTRQRPRKSTKNKSNPTKQARAQSELISRMPIEVFAEVSFIFAATARSSTRTQKKDGILIRSPETDYFSSTSYRLGLFVTHQQILS